MLMKYIRTFFKLFYGEVDDDEILRFSVMFCLVPCFLELIPHIIIVNFFQDNIFFCNWNTVVVFFENAGCANGLIGFFYYVFHPIICIFFAYKMISRTEINKNRKINMYDIKICLFLLILCLFFYWTIFLVDPYSMVKSYLISAIPSVWFTEFWMDFLLLEITFFSTVFFLFNFYITIKVIFYE